MQSLLQPIPTPSKEALMTCLVFDRQNQHVHFIDGGDGGYALAAKELKKRMLDTATAKKG